MGLADLFYLTGIIFFTIIIIAVALFLIIMFKLYTKTTEQLKRFTTVKGFIANIKGSTKPLNLILVLVSAVFTYFLKKKFK
ncbi:MAG: hypothetical protein KatS3mg091_423 [Patescibacteria group bacterium]|nr:MAG: hypothetical protein KatS3mg091_423 [Patescibacteria group bacterium]